MMTGISFGAERESDEQHWALEREQEAQEEAERAYEAQRQTRAEYREMVQGLLDDMEEKDEEIRRLKDRMNLVIWRLRALATTRECRDPLLATSLRLIADGVEQLLVSNAERLGGSANSVPNR